MGFPSSDIHPFLGMPCSLTPADSPAQSPYPTPTGAFPSEESVGIRSIRVTGLDHVHLRYGLSVALSTLRRGRYLARRKACFLLAGWALAGKELHLLDR